MYCRYFLLLEDDEKKAGGLWELLVEFGLFVCLLFCCWFYSWLGFVGFFLYCCWCVCLLFCLFVGELCFFGGGGGLFVLVSGFSGFFCCFLLLLFWGFFNDVVLSLRTEAINSGIRSHDAFVVIYEY